MLSIIIGNTFGFLSEDLSKILCQINDFEDISVGTIFIFIVIACTTAFYGKPD